MAVERSNTSLCTNTTARADFLPLQAFLRSLNAAPQKSALWAKGKTFSYAEMAARAGEISHVIRHNDSNVNSPTCAILAYRSVAVYSSILGILAAGKAYVPLSPKLPPARNLSYIKRTGCSLLVVESDYVEMALELVSAADWPITLIIPSEVDDIKHIKIGQHTVLHCQANPVSENASKLSNGSAPENAEKICYVLFTSGSTGTPKGVAVTSGNVAAYIENIITAHQPDAGDRFSQVFDITFDLSVHDMFVCWAAGATLYCLPEEALIAPGAFIREHALTQWFSTPSTAAAMERLGLLKPGSLGSIRRSLFCGEALPTRTAKAWLKASNGAPLFNLYGPTETTIAITSFSFIEDKSGDSQNDVVPIGIPFKGQSAKVVDENLLGLPDGVEGELLLSGTQITPGYWGDEKTTGERFVALAGESGVWYRTGDRVKRRTDSNLIYLGRMDQQIKIMGHRVDLMEIEATVRQVSGSDLVAAIGWPQTLSGADGVVAFVSGSEIDKTQIIEGCAKTLPRYMVPKRIIELADLPRTASGKIDRKALAATLLPP
jgi:D-alanine--poly(phosphoribitol) ligase subunit 1